MVQSDRQNARMPTVSAFHVLQLCTQIDGCAFTKRKSATMKIHLSIAILFCFKLGASLCRDITTTLGTVLDKSGVVVDPIDASNDALSERLLTRQQCPEKDACKFLFFEGTKMHRKRVRGRICVQGCMLGFYSFYLQRGWTCGGCKASVEPPVPPVRPPIPAPVKAPTKAPMVSKDAPKAPTVTPINAPTKFPSKSPTKSPTKLPTKSPTKAPTKSPTKAPTKSPTKAQTNAPTKSRTKPPTKAPTKTPTKTPTKSPTKAPVKICTSTTDIVNYINGITLSGQTLSLSGSTSSEKALQQLVSAQNTTLLNACLDDDRDRLRQRYAYLAFVFATGKENEKSWFDEANECQWQGVACVAARISTIDLFNQGLFGTISVDVGLWYDLKNFSVPRNALQGSLPLSVGNWTGLTNFEVNRNKLGGSLPSSIGKWTGLTSFNASINQLGGSLPSSIGAFTGLTLFNVAGNLLQGALPSSIGAWTNLTSFNVANNLLEGPLPSSIGAWTELTTISLSRNLFTGTVPTSVSSWTAIETILLTANSFNGTMPPVANNFCPKSTNNGNLWADCAPPAEIVCKCCNYCCGTTGCFTINF
jgi:Leucine-rich repeat (LRR) protein